MAHFIPSTLGMAINRRRLRPYPVMGEWAEDANCHDRTYLFFGYGKETPIMAEQLCGECPVRTECGEYVLSMPSNPEGYWAGMTEEDRRKVRRERRLAVFDS